MKLGAFYLQMCTLAAELIPTIEDDYRASDDPSDDTPAMQLTIGADADGWGYQTGDNSFTGGAYCYRDWAVVTLTRDSDPADIAEEIIDDLCSDDADAFAAIFPPIQPNTTRTGLHQFVSGYLDCALWAETANGVPEDTGDGTFDTSFECYGLDRSDIAPEAMRRALYDCAVWFHENLEAMRETTGSYEQHGHDYWLTRNGHGAGFRDRGYGKLGDTLTEAAHTAGSVDLYYHDGKIWGF